MRLALGFARFWYDFIVGDSVATAVGAAIAMAVTFLLVATHLVWPAELVLPALIVATLAWSLRSRG